MKKLLAALLAMILMLSLLSGCSGGDDKIESDLLQITSEEDLGFDGIDGESNAGDGASQGGNNNQGGGGSGSGTVVSGGWTADSVGAATPEEMDKPYPLRKNISGKVVAFHPFAETDMIKKAGENFRKSYPNATLEIVPALWGERDAKLAALIASGSPPDFVYGTTLEYPFRAISKMTQPIDDYVQSHPAQNRYLMDNYGSYKGKLYCVTTYEPCLVLWYNKTMFDQKGEKYPSKYFEEGNWTWDTFKQVAKRMTDSSKGVWGFTTDIDWYFPLAMGQDILRFQNGKAVLNVVGNNKFVQGYQFLLDMILVDKSTRQEHWYSYDVFADGKAAMFYSTADHHKMFDQRATPVNYDFTMFPKYDKNSPYVTLSGALGDGSISIGAGAKNIQGGMAFGEMIFNTHMETQKNMTLPLYKRIYETSLKANVQFVQSWTEGYDLYGLYYHNFSEEARSGQKGLNNLINEYAPLFNAKLNEMTK